MADKFNKLTVTISGAYGKYFGNINGDYVFQEMKDGKPYYQNLANKMYLHCDSDNIWRVSVSADANKGTGELGIAGGAESGAQLRRSMRAFSGRSRHQTDHQDAHGSPCKQCRARHIADASETTDDERGWCYSVMAGWGHPAGVSHWLVWVGDKWEEQLVTVANAVII